MDKFVALAFSGLTEGAVIALAAVGLLVLYKATSVINFAHGDLITLGAYLMHWLYVQNSWGYMPALLTACGLMFAVGIGFERVAVAPLRGRSVHVVVIATLGLALTIRTLLAIWQTSSAKRLSSPLQDGNSRILGATVNHHRLFVVAVATGVLLFVMWLFAHTGFGRQVRAIAADRDMARLSGVRVSSLSMVAFGLSATLAGLAGILIAPLFVVDLTLGFGVMLNAFAAMIVGGFGSLRGVALASLVIGLSERLLGGYVLTQYSETIPFILMIAVIAYKPTGLFGGEIRAARF